MQLISNALQIAVSVTQIHAIGPTVGAEFRVAAIIRVAAVFGALKIIFSDLFFFAW